MSLCVIATHPRMGPAAVASGVIASDAVLAVYTISHRAVLRTNDADFSRFPGLQWRNPLSPP